MHRKAPKESGHYPIICAVNIQETPQLECTLGKRYMHISHIGEGPGSEQISEMKHDDWPEENKDLENSTYRPRQQPCAGFMNECGLGMCPLIQHGTGPGEGWSHGACGRRAETALQGVCQACQCLPCAQEGRRSRERQEREARHREGFWEA